MIQITDWADFIELCKECVEKDKEAQKKENETKREKFLTNPRNVMESGDAIELIYSGGKFSTKEKVGNFREGDFVGIVPSKLSPRTKEEFDDKVISGRIVKLKWISKERKHSIQVGVDKSAFKDKESYVFLKGDFDLTKQLKKVLDRCKYNEKLEDIIEGRITDNLYKLGNFEIADDIFSDLNSAQKEAIKRALNSKFYYVQGPPGTGKTITLVHLAYILAQNGLTVGIICFTHRALNKVATEMCKFLDKQSEKGEKDLPVVWRIAEDFRIDKELSEYQRDEKKARYLEVREDLRKEDISKKRILVFVVHKVHKLIGNEFLYRNERKFDCLIFDEAGQISIPYIIMAMYFGRRFFFFGDHNQLAPVSSLDENASEQDKSIMKTSILEKLMGYEPYKNNNFRTLLKKTYRLPKELAEFPNKIFYNGELESEVRDKISLEITEKNDDNFARQVIFNKKLISFVDVIYREGVSYSRNSNYVDAQIVADIFCKLWNYYRSQGITSEEIFSKKIGIISPYRNQCAEIRERIYNKIGEDFSEFEPADTVERFQGQERDVIIVSYAHTSNANVREDFIYDEHRFNVCITRAREKLIVVGNHRFFSDGPEVFQKFYRYVEEKGYVIKTPEEYVSNIIEAIGKESVDQKELVTSVATTIIVGSPYPLVGNYYKYRLVKEIERGGGIGIIYTGEDNKGERVAIKKLREEFKLSPAIRKKFKEEFQILEKLKDISGVVQVKDFVELDDDLYLISEYIDGKTICQHLSQFGPFSPSKAKQIILWIGKILASVHEKHIWHLDIKPTNIMLLDDNDCPAKLIDFGIARDSDAWKEFWSDNPEVIAGTLPYMAPEQHLSQSSTKISHKSDIYSVGILLYEMLTDALPFAETDMEKLYKQKCNKNYKKVSELVKGIPAEFDQIIDRALRPEPEKRFASMEEFVGDLQKVNTEN